MMYAVTVSSTDDHPGTIRTYGPFRSLARAERFCREVCEKADQLMDEGDETSGYAWVVSLRSPDIANARAWLVT